MKSTELLVMASFARCLDGNGKPISRLAFKEPVQLPKVKGKTAESLYRHGAQWFKTLAELGHQGISIQHLVMDKAGFDLLCDHWEAHMHNSLTAHVPHDMSPEYFALLLWVVRFLVLYMPFIIP